MKHRKFSCHDFFCNENGPFDDTIEVYFLKIGNTYMLGSLF